MRARLITASNAISMTSGNDKSVRTEREGKQPPDYDRLGRVVSFLVHVCLFGALLTGGLWQRAQTKYEVYSLSVIPGRKLGGVSQVPEPGRESETPPMKRPERMERNSSQPDLEVRAKLEQSSAASIVKEQPKEKKEAKRSPKPSPGTPTPRVTSTPTPTPSRIPTRKPTLKPTPKPTVVPPKPTQVATASVKEKQPVKEPKSPTKKPSHKATSIPAKGRQAEPSKENKASAEYEKSIKRYLGESVNAGGQGFGAARTGGSGSGGGTQRPREFFVYFERIQREIKSNWRWYDASANLRVEVEMKIAASGRIEFARIVEPTRVAEFDRSVMRAIEAADPLPPPPASVYKYFKHVIIVFDPRD